MTAVLIILVYALLTARDRWLAVRELRQLRAENHRWA
jgi:hypothetical protein